MIYMHLNHAEQKNCKTKTQTQFSLVTICKKFIKVNRHTDNECS